jgi:hypothetical protein
MVQLKLHFEGRGICYDFIKNNINVIESSLEDCDYVISDILKVGVVSKKQIQNSINDYKKYTKKVLFFLVSDFEKKLKLPPNMLLFRTSIRKSKQQNNEYLLPYVWEYFDNETTLLPKTDLPIVGFCGNVKNNMGKRLSTIKVFEKSDKVQSNFDLKKEFWGGKPGDQELIENFKNNIINSHFTICNRGRGNFAIRFYQVLSLGRIPILVDSDMIFPFDDKINWNNLIIKSNDESKLLEDVLNFWGLKSNEEIVQIQMDCKKLHETYFTQSSYSDNLLAFLSQKRNEPLNVELNLFTKINNCFKSLIN